MPLFGSVLRAVRRSADEVLGEDGRIRARFTVEPAGRGFVELGEDELGEFVDAVAAHAIRAEESPPAESPAESFRRTVATRGGEIVFRLPGKGDVAVPMDEWADFVEAVREVRDAVASARRRLDVGHRPASPAAFEPLAALPASLGAGERRPPRARAPSPRHELEPLTDEQKVGLRRILAGRGPEGALSRTELHRAAVSAGLLPPPEGTPGLSNAQKSLLWSFLEAEPHAGRVKKEGDKGPEATRWYLRG